MSRQDQRYDSISGNNDNMFNHNCVKFVIWHTLRKLPTEEESTRTVEDESGRAHTCVLTHDWMTHLDVIEGDPRPIIARIEADFGPSFRRRRLFVENHPRKKLRNNQHVWRCFESRQKCAGTPRIQFTIIGMGGTILQVKSDPDLQPVEGYFFEKNSSGLPNPVLPIPLPVDRAFSIDQFSELPEPMDCENTMSLPPIISWKRGEEGLTKIHQSLVNERGDQNLVNTVISIKLWDSTPDKNDLLNLTKFCQNFIKYEDAIDWIIDTSRDLISLAAPLEPLVVNSNKSAVEGKTNRERHDALEARCGSFNDLVKAMNPRESQLYRLLLEENAVRFFFAAVPCDVEFTLVLVRFCTLFVHNSFRFQTPRPLKSSRTIEEQINFLFSVLIRDRFLEETMLLGASKDGDMSLCSSFLGSMEDGEASFSLSLERNISGFSNFNDFSNIGDIEFPDRKRPRPMSPPISSMTQDESFPVCSAQSLDVDVVLRSHLCIQNKYYTAAKLAMIGKKLSTGTSNKKAERLSRLKAYFDARNDELSKCFENETQCSGILGIEFFFQNDPQQDENNICVILQGGKQMRIPRRSVCQSKYGEKEFPIEILSIHEDKAKAIFEHLYPKETTCNNLDDYISRIDDFIEDLGNNQNESCLCRFALIHDLFSNRNGEEQSNE